MLATSAPKSGWTSCIGSCRLMQDTVQCFATEYCYVTTAILLKLVTGVNRPCLSQQSSDDTLSTLSWQNHAVQQPRTSTSAALLVIAGW